MSSRRPLARRFPSRVIALATVIAAMAAAPKASAVAFYFFNTGDDRWNNANAWFGAVPTEAGSLTNDIYFQGGSNPNQFTPFNMSANMNWSSTTVGSLNFTWTTDTLTGNTIQIGKSIQASTGGNSISNNLVFDTNAVDFNVTGGLTCTGAITGQSALQKKGAGTLTLSGSNSLTGGLKVFAGTVKLGSNSALSGGDTTFLGGNVDLNGTGATFENMIYGDSTLAATGGLIGTNAFTLDGSILYNSRQDGTTNALTLANNITLTAGRHYIQTSDFKSKVPAYDVLISGAMSGFGGITLNTLDERVALTGANTYLGATEASYGTMILGATNTLPTNTALTVGGALFLNPTVAGPGLVVGNYSQTVGSLAGFGNISLGSATLTDGGLADTTYGGVMFGTGAFVKNGAGTQTLTGINTYTGGTTIQAGRLIVTNLNGNYVDNGWLETNLSGSLYYTGTISGTGAFVMSGNGTFVLGGADSYSGGTLVTGGILVPNGLGNAGLGSTSAPLEVDAGGTFDLVNYDVSVGTFSGAGSVILNPSRVLTTSTSAASTFSGIISGSGALSKTGTGTLTLSGKNTYTGGTTIGAGGKLIVTDPVGSYLDNAALEVDHEDTLNPAVLNGTVTGPGSFVKSGAGNLFVPGALKNTGTVTVSGGMLSVLLLDRNFIDNAALTVYGSTGTQTGVISGTGYLRKNAVSDLTLTGTNTYSGGTQVYGGRLITSSNGSLGAGGPIFIDTPASLISDGYDVTTTTLTGAGALSIKGAKLTIGDTTDFTFGGTITGNSSTQLVKNGTGTATLSGNNSYSGLTSVNAGRLVVNKPAGNYNLSGILEFALVGDQTLNSLVSGTGSVVVSGGHILTALPLNTYSGGTTINAGSGVLAYSPNGNYVDNGSLEVHDDLDGSLAGSISGTGSLTKSGSNNFFVTGNNSFTGGTTVQFGTFAAASTMALAGGNVTILTGGLVPVVANVAVNNLILGDGATTSIGGTFGIGSLALTGGITVNNAANKATGPVTLATGLNLLSGLHTITDNGNRSSAIYDTVLSGAISGVGGLLKTGTNLVALNAANSYTGGTEVSKGTLYLSSPGALPSAGALTVDTGGTVSLSPTLWGSGVTGGDYSQTVGSLAGPGSIQLGAATLTVNNTANATWDGVISGGGSLIKSGGGNLLLTGANSYTGGTIVQAGKLIVHQPNGTSYDDRARIEFNASANASATFAGVVSGIGGVDKAGAGNFTLSGLNTYTGGTNVIGGRLFVSNPVGSYNVSANLEFSNAADVTSSGAISGTGTLTKSGTGTATLLGTNTLTGTFRTNLGTLAAGSPGAFANSNVFLAGGNIAVNVPNVAIGALTFGDALSTTIGSISGPGSIALSGGMIFKYMPSTKTAPVTIGSSVVLGNGTHNLDDNGLRSTGAYDGVFSGGISGSGSLNKTGTDIFTMTGADTYTGSTTLTGGTLYAAAANVLAPTSAFSIGTGATLSLNPTVNATGVVAGNYSQQIGSLSGTGNVLLGSATLTTGDATNTSFSGVISGSGSLVKTGSGTFTLSGTQSYGGGTTIGGGKLIVDVPNGNYLDNAALQFSLGTVPGIISGTGSLIQSGPGTLILSGANSYTGGTTIAGRLIASIPTGDYSDAGILEFSNGADTTASGIISGTGSLVKSGAGSLLLSGLNTYSGGTTIGAGRLIVTNPTGTYADGSALDVRNSSDLSFDGSTVTGSGSFAKSGLGTLNLTQKLGNTGGIEIEAGTLKSTTGLLAGRTIVGDAGATLQLDTTGTTFYSTDYSGAGNLLKTGSGRLILDGALANTGSTTIGGGALYAVSALQMNGLTVNAGARFINDAQDTVSFEKPVVTQGEIDTTSGSTTVFEARVSGAGGFSGFGTVQFNGGYSPGNSPAAVTLQGDMVLGSSNDLTMELGGTTLGTGYDHLTVDGTAYLNGVLHVAWYGNFAASLGQSFDLFDFSHSTGSFSSIDLPTLRNGLNWNTSSLYSNGTLSVQAVPEPASMAILGMGALALLRRRKK